MIDWLNGALATLAASISVDNVGGTGSHIFLNRIRRHRYSISVFTRHHSVFHYLQNGGLLIIMLLGGSLLGTSINYWVSRLLGPRFVNWVGRRSKFLRRNIEQLQNRLGRWTIPVIVAARLTPGLMQVSSVAAGTMRVRYYQMVLAIVLSLTVYDGTLIILGTLARLGLKDVGPEYAAWIVLGFVAIMAAIFVAVHLIRHRAKLS